MSIGLKSSDTVVLFKEFMERSKGSSGFRIALRRVVNNVPYSVVLVEDVGLINSVREDSYIEWSNMIRNHVTTRTAVSASSDVIVESYDSGNSIAVLNFLCVVENKDAFFKELEYACSLIVQSMEEVYDFSKKEKKDNNDIYDLAAAKIRYSSKKPVILSTPDLDVAIRKKFNMGRKDISSTVGNTLSEISIYTDSDVMWRLAEKYEPSCDILGLCVVFNGSGFNWVTLPIVEQDMVCYLTESARGTMDGMTEYLEKYSADKDGARKCTVSVGVYGYGQAYGVFVDYVGSFIFSGKSIASKAKDRLNMLVYEALEMFQNVLDVISKSPTETIGCINVNSLSPVSSLDIRNFFYSCNKEGNMEVIFSLNGSEDFRYSVLLSSINRYIGIAEAQLRLADFADNIEIDGRYYASGKTETLECFFKDSLGKTIRVYSAELKSFEDARCIRSSLKEGKLLYSIADIIQESIQQMRR